MLKKLYLLRGNTLALAYLSMMPLLVLPFSLAPGTASSLWKRARASEKRERCSRYISKMS